MGVARDSKYDVMDRTGKVRYDQRVKESLRKGP